MFYFLLIVMMLVKMFLEIFNLMVNIDGYRDEDS